MKFSQDWRIIFTIAATILILYSLWFFRAILGYALVAVVLSFIGEPLTVALGKIKIRKWTLPAWFRSLVALSSFIVAFFLLAKLFTPLLAEEARILSEIDARAMADQIEEQLAGMSDTYYTITESTEDINITEYLISSAQELLSFSWFKGIFANVFGFVGSAFIAIFAVLFMAFFFLKDQYLFSRIVFTLTPDQHMAKMKNIMEHSHALLRRFFVGVFIQSLSMAVLVWLGLYFLGVKNALLIGLFAGIVNVIPYLGPLLAAGFGLLVALTTTLHLDFTAPILPLLLKVTLVFVVVQQIDAFLIQPLVLGSSVKAHPLEIFVVILAAGTIGGVLGMVLAIPGYTILRIVAREFLSEFKVVGSLTRDL